MAFITLPNGIKVSMLLRLNLQLVVNVHYVVSPTGVSSANLQEAAEAFRDWWITDLRPNFVAAIALEGVVAVDWTEANGEQFVLTVAPPIPGTGVGVSTPNNVAIVVSHRSAKTGRSFRGRTYHAGINNGEVADNQVSVAYVTNVLNDYAALVLRLAPLGLERVIASFRANGLPRVVGVGTSIIQESMDTRVDTQRRRLPGVGT